MDGFWINWNHLEPIGMRASLRSHEHAGQLKVRFQKSMNLYEFAQNHWFMKVWRSGEQCSLAWDVRPLPRSYWGFYMIIRIMIYHVYLHTNVWHVFISKDIECKDIILFVQRWQHLFSWVAFLQIPEVKLTFHSCISCSRRRRGPLIKHQQSDKTGWNSMLGTRYPNPH